MILAICFPSFSIYQEFTVCLRPCQTADGDAELVCRLNLWETERFKYVKGCQDTTGK